MKRQTALGLLFLIVGLVILAAVLGPTFVGLFAKPPVTPAISFTLLLVSIVLAVFGALLIDPSGVEGGLTTVTVKLKDTSLPWIGGGGAKSTQITAIVTTPAPEPPPLPRDGAA